MTNFDLFMAGLAGKTGAADMTAAALEYSGCELLREWDAPELPAELHTHPLTNAALAEYLVSVMGWWVFPCREKSEVVNGETKNAKTPYTPHGFKDAVHTLPAVRAFWLRYPGALVGIDCGRSDLFVLDLDRHAGDPDGVVNFLRLAKGASIDSLCFQDTPAGGVHMLYAGIHLPAGFSLPGAIFDAGIRAEYLRDNPNLPDEKRKKQTIGIDIRKAGGYICTGVLADGRKYEWQSGLPVPSDICANLPAFILEKICEHNVALLEKKAAAIIAQEKRDASPVLKSGAADSLGLIAEFEKSVSWDYILPGWTRGKTNANHWTRPGGATGGRHAETKTYKGADWIRVWSESCAIPAGCHSKYMAWVFTAHGGDKTAAIRSLWAENNKLKAEVK